MKISIADDRPSLLPVLLTALIAGLTAVIVSSLIIAAGASGGGLVTLVAVGAGLLTGLLLQDRVEARVDAYRA